ncbi:MAG: hypothetical protein OEY89_13365 [Gammaproteobacteria bacterium]|nr:hypothetical protein [Gammaproteobacteria bacterium]
MKNKSILLAFISLTVSNLVIANTSDTRELAKENYERVNRVFSDTKLGKRNAMKKEFVDKILIDIEKVNKVTPYKIDETLTLIRASYKNDIKTTYSEYDIKKAMSLYKTNRAGVIKRLKAAISSNLIQEKFCSNFSMATAIEMYGIMFQDIYTEKGTNNVIAKNVLQTCKIQ